MRKKLFIIFTAMGLASVFISGYVIVTIHEVEASLENLIKLHRVAAMRDRMLYEIKVVQDDLHLKQTRYARDLSRLVSHVSVMTQTIEGCFDCHHEDDVIEQLYSLKKDTEVYKSALSRVYTIRANRERLIKEQDNAFMIGQELVREVEDMLTFSHRNLDFRTEAILSDVNRSKYILFVFTVLAPIAVVCLVFWFYLNFTRPVSALLEATTRIKEGDLNYRIGRLSDEFGEVAQSFNEMSGSLKEVMQNMVRSEQMVLMGEMASRLAHEIKNPITGIKLAAELIRDEAGLKGEYEELCHKTIEQIKNIEKLMKGLLSFAKPPLPELEREDLNAILDTSLSTVEILIQKKSGVEKTAPHVTIDRDLGKDLPPVSTDASQLQQVFLNLFLNAYDAMREGGTLTVRSYQQPDKGMLTVDITDTGEGIDPDLYEKIFLPFYSTKPRGTGLGLAIVNQLTQRLGGEVTFKSELAVGTTFSISLPLYSPRGDEQG